MKNIIIALLLFGTYSSKAQTVSYEDFKSLIPSLQKEDWKTAFEQSSRLIESAENDTSDYKAIVIYINIFSAAGMVAEGTMTYSQLERHIMKFQGQKIIMSAHPVTKRDGALRQTQFEISNTKDKAYTTSTNAKGTNILCFEVFEFSDKINLEDFPEKSFVRCGGTLDKIELNPNRSLVWIVRLKVKDAFARKPN